MPKETTTEPAVSINDLAAAFTAAMQAVKPEKELKEGDPEYVARQRAEGWFDTFGDPERPVVVLQNAYEAQARGLSADVRERAAKLKPGSYLKNRVKVTVENDGAIVRLSYPVSGDAMLINQSHWTSFEDLVNKIWAEQEARTPVLA